MTTRVKTTSKILVLVLTAQLAMLGEDKSPLPLPTSGNVTLTLAEYDRLVDLAGKTIKKHEAPPVAYAIKHADLKLRVGSDSVLGTVVEDGEVFSRNAAKVPLTSGLTIFNARQQGKAVPLLQDGAMATAVLPGAQEFSVTLDTGLPLTLGVGSASFSLPVPAAGSVRLSLAIPGDHTNVRISPGLITSRNSENGHTTIEATLAPGQPASVWWDTRVVAPPVVRKEVRFLSDVKTLLSVGEDSLRAAVLADVNLVQGEPSEFKLTVPTDYEISDVSGASVEGSEINGNELTVRLTATAPVPRAHQFLISMEKQLSGAAKVEAPFVSFNNTQRETGEVLVEAAGAMELIANEGGGLKRMDLKEVNPYLRSLARFPLQAAFRFHRQPNETPALALNWTRFPDSTVLAAVAEHAVVTTMVTTEGRSLTEVRLTVKNQAQPFLKVDLPKDASILSADVAGEKVKPVQGPDGARVPLLRSGFRPTDAYEVSFVFLHSGSPFAKKGGSELALPSMDIPISVLEWEVYLPEQYKVKDFGGDAIAASLLGPSGYKGWLNEDVRFLNTNGTATLGGLTSPIAGPVDTNGANWGPGQLGGTIVDPQGAVIANAQVTVTSIATGISRTVRTNASGLWRVGGMPAGEVKIEASAKGFRTTVMHGLLNDPNQAADFGALKLNIGSTSSTVEITAAAPAIDTTPEYGRTSGSIVNTENKKKEKDKERDQAQQAASANVVNLQKRVAGILPVRVDVPRAGSSYRFARALVLDEETKLTFTYSSTYKTK
jgi:hypothetical protein